MGGIYPPHQHRQKIFEKIDTQADHPNAILCVAILYSLRTSAAGQFYGHAGFGLLSTGSKFHRCVYWKPYCLVLGFWKWRHLYFKKSVDDLLPAKHLYRDTNGH